MIIGTEMKGGGRIDVDMKNGKYFLKLHHGEDVFRFKESFSTHVKALRYKEELEKEAGNLGSLRLIQLFEDSDIFIKE